MSQPAIVMQRPVDVEDLHGRTAAVCARLAQAHAELVEITGELLETELWAEGGIRSPQHWLIVRAGLSPSRAREIVELAQRARELPETLAAMSAGRLGVDQAAVVARYVPAAYSAQACELAELATVPQLRRSLSRYAFADEPPVTPAAAADADVTDADLSGPTAPGDDGEAPAPGPETERARLSMSTIDGRFELSYSAPASIGALVEASIREAKDALFQAGCTEATLADGLAEVANRSLSSIENTSRAGKYRIYVHLDTHGGWVGRGGRLPAHVIDGMTCDGVLQPVWETDGVPVSVGRAQRVVPDRTRRLVEARDQGCRYPGCSGHGHVEAHHIVHWRSGGRTDLDQLISLCPYHHDRHHEGEFTITGTPARPDGLTFWARGGWPLRPLAAQASGLPQNSPDAPDAPGLGRAERPWYAAHSADVPWSGPTGERLQTRHLYLAPNPTARNPAVPDGLAIDQPALDSADVDPPGP